MSALRALAAAAPVPVFVAIGADAGDHIDDLGLQPSLQRVASPRHASVLLVAGEVREHDVAALRRLHDQLPHPRATLCWACDAPANFGAPRTLPPNRDPVPALRELYRQLLAGEHPSEPDLLPDEPPAPWRGVGEYGQGGKGMMGGAPYGRPMPMTDDDLRDGLALDAYTLRLGPFMPTLPAGLVLSLTVQGDVIQHAHMESPPLWPAPPSSSHAPYDGAVRQVEPFDGSSLLKETGAAAFAGSRPRDPGLVGSLAAKSREHDDRDAPDNARTLAHREYRRAAQHLRCIARLLAVLELASLAERCRRMACAVEHGEPCSIDALRRALVRSGAFAAIPPGLGTLDPLMATVLGGTARRAADVGVGERRHDQAGREPDRNALMQRDGDVRARLHQWLDEAEQSMRLAHRAGDVALSTASRADELDAEHDPLPADKAVAIRGVFTTLLRGLEWHEAMLVINSFEVAALRRMYCPPGDAPHAATHSGHAT
ncbi:hypothetical protein ACO2Q2_12470 [Dyella sp. KRB-257]|uniref:hypothetical protein n=1 Tax=Dyella sp. KRB-257 TaxID=3400915 RepID=UPI003BFFD80F